MTPLPAPARPLRLLATAAWSLALVPVLYSALRVLEVLRNPPLDPTQIVYASHVGFYARGLTALFLALLLAFPLHLLGAQRPAALVLALRVYLPLAGLAVAAQVVFFP